MSKELCHNSCVILLFLLITLSYVVRVHLLCFNFYILCYTAALLLYSIYYAQYYCFTRQYTPLTLQQQLIQLAVLYGSTAPAMLATNTLTSVTNSLSIHSLIATSHTKAALFPHVAIYLQWHCHDMCCLGRHVSQHTYH